MGKPAVTIIVCGRFHYHQYIRLLCAGGMLNKFIYSYKIKYDFGVHGKYLHNYPLKEYLLYAGRKLLTGFLFDRYLCLLHRLWQRQVLMGNCEGQVAHVLLHGNCYKIIDRYKKAGIVVVGEVVNAHPEEQEYLLDMEYQRHGLTYRSGEKFFKQKIIRELQSCDYLLAPSSFVKRSLINQGIREDKIKVLPYGLNKGDAKKKVVAVRAGENIRLICIAQVTFRKGIVYLLDALDILQKHGCHCTVTLVGHLDPLYKRVVSRYLAHPAITWLAHVDNGSVAGLLMQHDLLVMPSIEDGFGIVVAEALAVQLPVIVTENCGAAEIVTDGINGFIVPAFSANAIADAVVRSVEHPFNFEKKQVPGWDDYVAGLARIYEAVTTK